MATLGDDMAGAGVVVLAGVLSAGWEAGLDESVKLFFWLLEGKHMQRADEEQTGRRRPVIYLGQRHDPITLTFLTKNRRG